MVRIDTHMYLVAGDHLVPITNDRFSYAATNTKGAAVALAFCVESAEGVIAEAAKDGLPVEEYYGVSA